MRGALVLIRTDDLTFASSVMLHQLLHHREHTTHGRVLALLMSAFDPLQTSSVPGMLGGQEECRQ